MTSFAMITSSLLFRAVIEYLSCIITILLNILFIAAIIRPPSLRTPQNILLVNSALNLICSCFTFLVSVTIALQYSINPNINMKLCRTIGYLIYTFYHGIMYSYLLLGINHFLNMFYRPKKYQLSMRFTIFEIILQWLLSFSISSIPLIFNKIEFQIKPRFCSVRKPSFMLLGIFTGCVLPIIFMTIFYFIIYFHINKFRTNVHLSFRKTRKNKSNQFRQVSLRLYNRQKEKKFKLLSQFAAFSCVFITGWGFFTLISILDMNDIIPESIYFITLSFPAVSLLIITLMIINWNKLVKKSIFTFFNNIPVANDSTARSFNCN